MTDPDIRLDVAAELEWSLCAGAIQRFHYLRTFPDPRCLPLVYSVRLGGEWVGTLVFGRTESNRCYQGELTYGGPDEVASGRAKYDRWEILSLARVWLSPDVQAGGRLCAPGVVPGFRDRKGVFRSAFASHVVGLGIDAVRFDYLAMYPPCFVDEPYQIRVVSSYCDTRVHRSTLYRASGFRLSRANREGVETWYHDRMPPLDPDQDVRIRSFARQHPRSVRKRNARGKIFSPGSFPFFH